MPKIKLLAPAGNYDAFLAAIFNGANAIYLAGNRFGARAYSNNFSNQEIVKAIQFAHIYDVKIYVTINTLIFDQEIVDFINFVNFLYENDCDGVIVQDIGLINLIKRRYPQLYLIVSTQSNVCSPNQASFFKKLGANQIVLARECNLDIIKSISNNCSLDYEVFGHGALCQSFSGQCLMSSFLFNRSGNRGRCSQPCRMLYTLMENQEKLKTSYLLSCKDLMTIEHLQKLENLNINMIKIEGRMKSFEYVGGIIKHYRQALNGNFKMTTSALDEIMVLFNREFTKGYLFDEDSINIVNDKRPNHQGILIGKVIDFKDNMAKIKLFKELSIKDGIRINNTKKEQGFFVNQMYINNILVKKASANEIIRLKVHERVDIGDQVVKTFDYNNSQNQLQNIKSKSNFKLIELDFKFDAKIGHKSSLIVKDPRNNKVEVFSTQEVTFMQDSFISKEIIGKQLNKLGDSPYTIKNLVIDCDQNIHLPIATINQLRRQAIQQLNELRQNINNYQLLVKSNDLKVITKPIPASLKIAVRTIKQLEIAVKYPFAQIYLPFDLYSKYSNKYDNLIPMLPRIDFKDDYEVDSTKILVNDVGNILKFNDRQVIANCYLNCTNYHSLATLIANGVDIVTLSLELSFNQIKTILSNFKEVYNLNPNLEVIVYGFLDLMVTKYCPIRKVKNTLENCNSCNINQYWLSDRFDYCFPLIKDYDCNIKVLNSQRLNLIKYLKELKNLNISTRIELTIEDEEETILIIEEFLKAYQNEEYHLELKNVTYGHFLKEVE